MPTRSHLRDEFAMVDDAFALSPIDARPALPSEADYESIRDAFMETSRGRWFLGEYAKRNRNADTSMVLDAVARIEQALAAQQRLQQQLEIQAVDDKALPEALTAIRNAVTVAEGAAAATLDGLALEQNLAPVRKGVRIIKEISWRWREIGADSRICDLIDSQVVAIEAACDQLVGADPRPALIAAFDMIRAELDGHDRAAPVTEEIGTAGAEMARPAEASAAELTSTPAGAEAVRAPDHAAAAEASAPAAPVQTPIAVTGAPAPPANVEAAAPAASVAAAPAPAKPVASAKPAAEAGARAAVADDIAAKAPVSVPPSKPVEAAPKPAKDSVEASVAPAKAAAPPTPAIGERAEVVDEIGPLTGDDDLDIIVVSKAEADAQDEALLEIVAAAMGAPEPAETKEFSPGSSIHFDIEDPATVDDDIVATFTEPPARAPESERPRVAAVPPAAPFQPSAAPTPAPVAVAPAPDPRPVSVAAPKPAPVVPPPAPMALAAAPVMQEPPKPAPVVQDVPKPAAVVQEQPRPAALVVQEQPKPVATATLHPLPKPIPQPSLGATLLANGLLQRPVAANDPLTPIRRMTQPEKIAFFS